VPAPTNGDPAIQHPAALGDALLFSAEDAGGGRELWRSDGTITGTARLVDIRPGPIGSDPAEPLALGGALYFSASDGATGRELWATDGTSAGTRRLSDIYPGAGSSSPQGLAAAAGGLLFSAVDAEHGRELWRLDTATGAAALVSDIAPGATSSNPAEIVRARDNGRAAFAAHGPAGHELYQTDGTADGTRLLADIAPGAAGSGPAGVTVAGGALLFSANDGASGREPWVLAASALNYAPVAEGDALSASSPRTFSGALLADDRDDDALRFRIVSPPAGGALALNESTGIFTFTPTLASDSFQFVANDGQADSNVATVTVTLAQDGRVVYLPVVTR
jgi:ELWxxDGT repeat protein